jgi:hypothetical protein
MSNNHIRPMATVVCLWTLALVAMSCGGDDVTSGGSGGSGGVGGPGTFRCGETHCRLDTELCYDDNNGCNDDPILCKPILDMCLESADRADCIANWDETGWASCWPVGERIYCNKACS